MNLHILIILLIVFSLGACVGSSGTGGVQGLDGVSAPGGQAQPSIQDVNEVEPGTPIEDCAPNDFDCEAQKKGFKAPGVPDPDPDPLPHGPDNLTI